MISTLTYLSTLHGSVDRPALTGLLEASRVRNADLGVTGLLLVRGRRVMQILEGGESQVRDLYARIRNDPRHRDVTQVWSSSGGQRRFPEWSMGFDDLEQDRGGRPAENDGHLARRAALTAEQQTFLNRRITLLRRGLASGNRLISALAVIMDAHDPEAVADGSEPPRLRCRQGCADDSTGKADVVPRYPCYTAQNAFWALDAAL